VVDFFYTRDEILLESRGCEEENHVVWCVVLYLYVSHCRPAIRRYVRVDIIGIVPIRFVGSDILCCSLYRHTLSLRHVLPPSDHLVSSLPFLSPSPFPPPLLPHPFSSSHPLLLLPPSSLPSIPYLTLSCTSFTFLCMQRSV